MKYMFFSIATEDMAFMLDTIQDDTWYDAKDIADKVGRHPLTVRIHIDTKLPDEYKLDQNKGGKYRKLLVSGRGVKYLY